VILVTGHLGSGLLDTWALWLFFFFFFKIHKSAHFSDFCDRALGHFGIRIQIEKSCSFSLRFMSDFQFVFFTFSDVQRR
jgi:hypothetical protein